MRPLLEKLLKVQEKDIRILRIEQELRDIPKRKDLIRTRLDEHARSLEEAGEALKGQQADVKNSELEISSCEQQIVKYREQQLQLKTNDEFRAMEREIKGVEAKIADLEDAQLKLLEAVDEANEDVAARKADLADEQAGVDDEVASIAERGTRLQGELEGLQAERAELIDDVDKRVLSSYERILANKKDAAVVAIANGTCGGCHMKLPPHVVHDVRKQDTPVLCEYCGRMLFFSA